MKKDHVLVKIFIIGVVLMLLFAACAPKPVDEAPAAGEPAAEEPAAPPEPPAEGEKVMVALLLPGPITDGGWDQLAYEGLQMLGEDDSFEVAYTENIGQAQIPEITRGYADDGYHLIIGHGFEFGSAFLEIAPEYPDQWFFSTTFLPQPEVAPNIRYVDPGYYEAGYTAGALAALMSETGTVGFVGGGDNPTQQGALRAFIHGAENTVEGTIGLGVVTGDYNDATKGREAATTMIGNGADVVWHAADVTGLGAIEGAIANDALVLGCYSDQTPVAPDHMGASVVMNLQQMVITLANEVKDGTFVGGVEWQPTVDVMWYWAAGDADHNSDIIDDATWVEFMTIWDDVAAGNIDVKALVAE